MTPSPSPSDSTTVRGEAPLSAHLLMDLARSISERGADVLTIDLVEVTTTGVRVDATFSAVDEPRVATISAGLQTDGYQVRNVSDRTFLSHLGGTIEVVPRTKIRTRDQLSRIYAPGVARISRQIVDEPRGAWNLTSKENTVAVVTDGTAVLGLGNVWPAAALPVTEGKAALFKSFANVNAFPICLDARGPDETVATVRASSSASGPQAPRSARSCRWRAPTTWSPSIGRARSIPSSQVSFRTSE